MFTCQEDKILAVEVHSLKFPSDWQCAGVIVLPAQTQGWYRDTRECSEEQNRLRASTGAAGMFSRRTFCWRSTRTCFYQ